jgi:lipoprotein-releasing system permease protein
MGLAGAVVGCVLGAVALRAWLHMVRTPDGSPVFIVTLHAWLLVQALLLATVTGLLAALAPALRAARLDPVVAIRG